MIAIDWVVLGKSFKEITHADRFFTKGNKNYPPWDFSSGDLWTSNDKKKIGT